MAEVALAAAVCAEDLARDSVAEVASEEDAEDLVEALEAVEASEEVRLPAPVSSPLPAPSLQTPSLTLLPLAPTEARSSTSAM